MWKRKDLAKRIAALGLVGAMVCSLLPQLDYHASGVTVEGYPIYNSVIFDAIEDNIKNTAISSSSSVYGSLGTWLYWDEENRVGMTHVYENTYFSSSRVNLRPSVSVVSADKNDYTAVFSGTLDEKITGNPDVSILFGATFTSTKSKPSMTVNDTTIGGSSLTKKKTESVSGKLSYPINSTLTATAKGASGTQVSNMWFAAIDDTSAKYQGMQVELKYDGLYFYVQMDESLRWANSEADQYMDDIYMEFVVNNVLTGLSVMELRATCVGISEDTMIFCCKRGDMVDTTTGVDLYEMDFSIASIDKINIPVINQIEFEVYGISAQYDRYTSYNKDTNQEYYTYIGNNVTYMQDVKLDTTAITDLAGNKVEFAPADIINLAFAFDAVTPIVEAVEINDVSGDSREAAATMKDKSEEDWPEDIDRADLFLGTDMELELSAIISEPIITSGTITAKLNVMDASGNQVVLTVASIQKRDAAVTEEKDRTVITFETFQATEGMSMMSGYENASIQILELTGTIRDEAGNTLTGNTLGNGIPTADKQIFLDVAAPEVTIEELENTNPRILEFQIKVADESAGVLGQYAVMELTAEALSELEYSYQVTATDGTTLAEDTGMMSDSQAGTIRWKLHGEKSYTAKVTIEITNKEAITADAIKVKLSTSDIVGNTYSMSEATSYEYKVDEVSPVIVLQPAEFGGDSSSVTVTVPFKVEDHSTLAYLKYHWVEKGKDPGDNWEAMMGGSNTANGNATLTIDTADGQSTANLQYTLWVVAEDSNGNITETSKDVTVTLEKPAIYYNDTAITKAPDPTPELIVVAPGAKSTDASSNAGAAAYVRVTVTLGENTYVRIVKSGDEAINVFDFTGTWYQVTYATDSTTFATVTELTEDVVAANLQAYYGEAVVSFEAAYADLTPVVGNALDANITDGSYVGKEENPYVSVLYAPVNATPTVVHQVSFGEVRDLTGETVLSANGAYGQSAVSLKQIEGENSVIAGTQFAFGLSNSLQEDWGVADIDFSKSYVALWVTDASGTRELDRQLLQNTANQTYALPAGLDYTTGQYYIQVCVYQLGSDVAAEYQSLNLVLDATTVKNAGLWEYYVRPDLDWANLEDAYTLMGDTKPLDSVGIVISDEQYIGRNNVFAYYSAGAQTVSLRLAAPETTETYDGISVGGVSGFRFWNSFSEMTEADLSSDNFVKTGTNDGMAYSYAYVGVNVCEDGASIPDGGDGFITGGQSISVVKGTNTIYYQVKLDNGTISDIMSFTFVVSDLVPTLDITVDSYVESIVAAGNGQIAVSSITMKIQDAYSMNGSGNVKIFMLNEGDADLTRKGETVDESYEKTLYVGDLVTFDETQDNTYSENNYGGEYDGIADDAKISFLVIDEYGGMMIITPQMGYTYADGASQNKFVVDGTDWQIRPFDASGSRNQGAYVESYLKVESADTLTTLVDYDSITFTIGTETFPMVDNYTQPNAAGYMGAVRNSSGGITVYIANQVDAGESLGWLSYTVNYKDIYGKEYSRVAGYGPYSVSNTVADEDMTSTGVDLFLNVAVAGGISAQHNGYGRLSTGLFQKGATFTGTYTDMFGQTHEITYTIGDAGWDFGVDASFSTVEPTLSEVVVTLSSTNPLIHVEESDDITIESNDSTVVKVTAKKNTTITFTVGEDTTERSVTVDNIVEFVPEIQWSFDESDILIDEDGTTYWNGPITAYVISGEGDEEDLLEVKDNYTGLIPSYTFYPGEATTYTFKGADYSVALGTTVIEGTDITVKLPVDELRNETLETEGATPAEDTEAPAVQLRAYANRNGVYANEQKAFQVEPGALQNLLTDYQGDEIFHSGEARAETTEYLDAIGWAATYRFQIELVDESDVKLFVKRGLFTEAPNYTIGGSDTIDGVSLNGRILEVSENTEFTLFAVDEKGNATAIPFAVTHVGEAPVPQVEIIYMEQEALVYIMEPTVGATVTLTDFMVSQMIGQDGMLEIEKETDAGSEYQGAYYTFCEENDTYKVSYSYTYEGQPVVGTLDVVIDEIDDVNILRESIKWSANKSKIATNQDVTVQLTYNKNVKEIQVPYGYQEMVDVLITGNRVTLRFTENVEEAILVTAVATNGTQVTFELDAVTNIDKVAPVVSGPELTLADNGKSVTATFVVDGETQTKTIKENGTHTNTFVDTAGNITTVEFTVDTIVDTPLQLHFSTTQSDAGVVENPEDISLRVGDTIYVKANRSCEANLNGGETMILSDQSWTAFAITENEAGLWPILYAEDVYGNTASQVLSGVPQLDVTAPVITLAREQIYAVIGTARADVLATLEANASINDADENVILEVIFTENLDVEGTTTVTYTATDSSGNTSTKTGWLKMTATQAPEVQIDGRDVERDGVFLANLTDALALTVDTEGEPYTVVLKAGIKTTAQMKTGVTTLVQNAEAPEALEIPVEEAGYYTICIRTQSREEYRFILYVE